MILLYQKGRAASPDEAEFIAGFPGALELRNAAFWQGEVETGTTEVYAHDERIRTAYSRAGALAHEVPTTKAETPMPTEKPAPARKTSAPKPATKPRSKAK